MGKTTITSIARAVTVAAAASLFSLPAVAAGAHGGGHGDSHGDHAHGDGHGHGDAHFMMSYITNPVVLIGVGGIASLIAAAWLVLRRK